MALEFGSSDSSSNKAPSIQVDYDEDHLRRARWRLFGAVIFACFVVAASVHLLLDDPRPLSHDFTVFISESKDLDTEPDSDGEESSPDQVLEVDSYRQPSSSAKSEASASDFASGKWYVQVGSYSNRGAAEQILKKIRTSGQSATVIVVKTPEGTRYRVRAGPYSEKQAWAYEKISRSMGYKPLVIKP
jgi:cell division septation protein DedD